MTTTQTLEQFTQTAFDHAKSMIESGTEEILPTFVCDTPEGICIVATPFQGENSKEAVARFMRKFLREHKASRYAFVSEAWARHMQGPYDGVPPSKCEGRQEIVFAIGEDGTGKVVHIVAEILRDNANKRSVGEVQINQLDHIEGRFNGLLGS